MKEALLSVKPNFHNKHYLPLVVRITGLFAVAMNVFTALRNPASSSNIISTYRRQMKCKISIALTIATGCECSHTDNDQVRLNINTDFLNVHGQ